MSKFVVIYAKVTDDKKRGLVFQGPLMGPARDAPELAETEARKLVNDAKNCTVIPRVYSVVNVLNMDGALEDARKYFTTLRNNMLEAKDVMARPAYRRKRKKQKQKQTQKIEKKIELK